MDFKIIQKFNLIFLFLIILKFETVFSILYPIAARLPLPGNPSPPGTPWPLPQYLTPSKDLAVLDPSFKYESNVKDCDILNRAFERYNGGLIFRDKKLSVPSHLPKISKIYVNLTEGEENDCSNYPKLSHDEEYEKYYLRIERPNTENENIAEVILEAKTIWGALFGLETFSQLFWIDLEEEKSGKHIYYANFTSIVDYPRYPWRGLMIDTARHYLHKNLIKEILDGMSYNKLNVFHWHIIDDQSFPFVSTTFPELSEMGAYYRSESDPDKFKYTPETVKEIIDYARDLGIRTIFEFDTPGHTQAFRHSHLELLTPCYGLDDPGTPNYPYHADYEILDPTKEGTYTFMKDLFTEIVNDVSKDEYVHLGMDEVYYACWESSPEIKKFMEDNGYDNTSQVQKHYTDRHIKMVNDLGAKPIIWHDPLDFGVELNASDALIQVWKDTYMPQGISWEEYTSKYINEGFNVIVSSCWYINNITNGLGPRPLQPLGNQWRTFYECDPFLRLTNVTEEQEKQIWGGEAAMWAEYIDTTNILPRLFPYVSTVSEKLWSKKESSTTDDAMWRLEEMRCLMMWRGIPAQPLLNGYCGSWDGEYPGLTKYHQKSHKNGSQEISGHFLFITIFSLLASFFSFK